MRLYVQTSSLYTSLFSILAEGRGSKFVRERTGMIAENALSETLSSRQVGSHALRAEAHSMGVSGLFMTMNIGVLSDDYRFSRSCVGMLWVTLRVIDLHCVFEIRCKASRTTLPRWCAAT